MSHDQLRLAWWVYALVSVGYTILVFSGELGGGKLPMAVKRDVRVLREVIVIHIVSITALVTMIWIATVVYPIMPSWVHYTARLKNEDISIFAMTLVAIGLGMSYLEGRLIMSVSHSKQNRYGHLS